MRKLMRLAMLLVAGAAALGVSASTPVDACAQSTCPTGCGKGNFLCSKSGCAYMWLADEQT